jgi:hypothetical protein
VSAAYRLAKAARSRLHDFWLLYAAPALPSRLPWRWAYACYRFMARFDLFPEPAAAAARVAPQFLPITDVEALKRHVRTVWLLDAVDLRLSLRHPTDWLPWHVTVEGAWPATGAFVAVSFHYSTGLWVFRDLRRRGRDVVLISARFDRSEYTHHPVRYRYGTSRMAEVERISEEPIAYRPGVRKRVLDVLARGMPVISVMDMPPRMAPRGQRQVPLLGTTASLPDGTVALARDAGVPLVPYWVEIDFARGTRKLVIGEPIAPGPIDRIMAELARMLDRLIRANPAAWLFWNEWLAWIRDAAELERDDGFSNAESEVRLDDIAASGPAAREPVS